MAWRFYQFQAWIPERRPPVFTAVAVIRSTSTPGVPLGKVTYQPWQNPWTKSRPLIRYLYHEAGGLAKEADRSESLLRAASRAPPPPIQRGKPKERFSCFPHFRDVLRSLAQTRKAAHGPRNNRAERGGRPHQRSPAKQRG
jgi:hypothetical protein